MKSVWKTLRSAGKASVTGAQSGSWVSIILENACSSSVVFQLHF